METPELHPAPQRAICGREPNMPGPKKTMTTHRKLPSNPEWDQLVTRLAEHLAHAEHREAVPETEVIRRAVREMGERYLGTCERRTPMARNSKAPDLMASVKARIANTPDLQPWEDIILYDWPEGDEHLNWALTAPAGEIISWAQDIRRNEPEQDR